MYKKPFFRFMVFMFLLFSQIFVYTAKSAPPPGAAKGLVRRLMDSGQTSRAAAVTDKLIADNPGNPALPEIITEIADYRAKRYDYAGARALYNRLIQLHPRDDYAKQAVLKMSKLDILGKIEVGSLSSAESDVERAITEHSKNSHFSRAMYDIAKMYAKRGYHNRAKLLFERQIKLCPADYFTDKAKFELVKNDIRLKFETGESAAVDDIVRDTASNYPGHTHLPEVLYLAADKYEENYKYEQARALYNQAVKANPGSPYSVKAKLESIKIDIYESIDNGDFVSAENLTENLIAKHRKHSYLPEVLYNIASYYTRCCNYERAGKLYSHLIELYQEDAFSSRAKVEIALLDIRSKIGSGTFKLAELEELQGKYEKSAFLARRLYELGYYCLDNNNYDTAIAILGLVCNQFPDSYFYYGRAKITCDTAKICKEIKTGSLSEAQTAIVKLEQDYAGYYYLPSQLYFIARVYSDNGYRDQSYALCDKLIKMGKSKYVAYGNIQKYRLDIHLHLQADDLAGAKRLFNEFKANYTNSLYFEEGILNLVQVFFEIGLRSDNDFTNDCVRNAILMCQAEKLPDSETGFIKAQSCILLGAGFLRLGGYVQSAGYYQKLVGQYPDSRYAGHAQFMIGQAYEKMLETGQISELQAKPLISSAYRKVVGRYPNCEAAVTARAKLATACNYSN
ncbi:MAG: tetratricopeptide repeat protein [Phycisphaerae bacterium]|nr:tetratricopeptide repeat protein [Phycisphaerae bacterium]